MYIAHIDLRVHPCSISELAQKLSEAHASMEMIAVKYEEDMKRLEEDTEGVTAHLREEKISLESRIAESEVGLSSCVGCFCLSMRLSCMSVTS